MTEVDVFGSVTASVKGLESQADCLRGCPRSCVRKKQRMGDDQVPQVMSNRAENNAVLPGAWKEPPRTSHRWGGARGLGPAPPAL